MKLLPILLLLLLAGCGTRWDLRTQHLVKPAQPPHERYCDEPTPGMDWNHQEDLGCILRPK